MARINLTTRPAFGVRYQHPNERPGNTTLIPLYHLVISLVVAPRSSLANWRPSTGIENARQFEAVLDTGTPLTLIPHDVWSGFADDVEILAQPSTDSELHVAGGRQNGQLGRFRLGALDSVGNWMPADWTIAIFLDEPTAADAATALHVPLLGLNSHFLAHQRRLCHIGYSEGELLASIPEWRLEDRPRWLPW